MCCCFLVTRPTTTNSMGFFWATTSSEQVQCQHGQQVLRGILQAGCLSTTLHQAFNHAA